MPINVVKARKAVDKETRGHMRIVEVGYESKIYKKEEHPRIARTRGALDKLRANLKKQYVHSIFTKTEVEGKVKVINDKISKVAKKAKDDDKALKGWVERWVKRDFVLKTQWKELEKKLNRTRLEILQAVNSLPLPPSEEELKSEIKDLVKESFLGRIEELEQTVMSLESRISELENG